MLGMLWYGYRRGYDRTTLVALFAAVTLYYFHFYHTPWQMFTMDPEAHGDYVKYIAVHGSLPAREETAAARHPPTYYMAAAGIYKIASREDDIDPLLVVRHLSMACFIVFTLLSIKMLRTFLPPPGAAYYSALCLLLFWPLGVTLGARITCDLLLYAAQMGVLYYLTRWFQTSDSVWFRGAFIWAGVCVLAKNTGVIMLGLSGAVLLLALYEHRTNIRAILRRDVCLAIIFSLCGYAITLMHGWITENVRVISPEYDLYYWLRTFISFNPYIFITDISVGDGHGMFWNMFIHSFLIGDVLPWKTSNILIAFNVWWLIVIIYLLNGARGTYEVSQADKRISRLFGAYIFLTIGAMMFMAIRAGNLLYADGRYIYPALPLMALFYGIVMERHYRAGRMKAYKTGIGLIVILVPLTVILINSQYPIL